MAKEVVLSTADNPFNPFTQPDEWYSFDVTSDHSACALLGRLAATSWTLPDEENDRIIEETMDRIIEEMPEGLYVKVYKE